MNDNSTNTPLILRQLHPFIHLEEFVESEISDRESRYDEELKIRLLKDGHPLWATRTKRIPTAAGSTPGRTIPAGYTPSGKYRPSKYVPAKQDKRAGK